MNEKQNKLNRIWIAKLNDLLQEENCIIIEGPKWCGKTFVGHETTKSQYYVKGDGTNTLYELNLEPPNPIFDGLMPRLIDEWQNVPQILDQCRTRVDQIDHNYQFVITGSTHSGYDKVVHSGAGRFCWLMMYTMSFCELTQVNQQVKIQDLFQKKFKPKKSLENIRWIVQQLIQGGWPEPIAKKVSSNRKIKNYIQSIKNQAKDQKLTLRPEAIIPILSSLARLNTSQINLNTLKQDLPFFLDERTIQSHLEYFYDLYLIYHLQIWPQAFKIRSKERIRTKPKIYLCDPSIGLSLLNVSNYEQAMNDLNTLGIYFENQVIKDLMAYAQILDGQLYFYRDADGLEIDVILQLANGAWAAIEIKLGDHIEVIEQAARVLNLFVKRVKNNLNSNQQPAFLMIITSGTYAYQRSDGIYVIPHTCLAP